MPDKLERKPQQGDALVVVDVQNDFLPGGSLAVSDGDAVIPVLNRCIEHFQAAALPIIATRDWHPPDHCSFKDQGGSWPPHCVATTNGAEFAPALHLPAAAIVISKGIAPFQDAYSGFDATDLDEYLQALGVNRLFVGGLATDYCVLGTVKDARAKGYAVVVFEDAVRAVNLQPDEGRKAVDTMKSLGAVLVNSAEIA